MACRFSCLLVARHSSRDTGACDMTNRSGTKPQGSLFSAEVRGPTIDLRRLIVRAADGLHDAATVGGAPNEYLAIERDLRYLIAALDEEARQR